MSTANPAIEPLLRTGGVEQANELTAGIDRTVLGLQHNQVILDEYVLRTNDDGTQTPRAVVGVRCPPDDNERRAKQPTRESASLGSLRVEFAAERDRPCVQVGSVGTRLSIAVGDHRTDVDVESVVDLLR